MKGLVAILVGISALGGAASGKDVPKTPREPDAIITSVSDAQVDALAAMVRLFDYKCDSVSAARPWLMSAGFTIHCNHFRYEYEVQDKGGHWTVTVK